MKFAISLSFPGKPNLAFVPREGGPSITRKVSPSLFQISLTPLITSLDQDFWVINPALTPDLPHTVDRQNP